MLDSLMMLLRGALLSRLRRPALLVKTRWSVRGIVVHARVRLAVALA